MKIAAAIFGLWALMLPISLGIIMRSVGDLHDQVVQHEEKAIAQVAAIIATENDINRRLYILETEHEDLKRRMSSVEDEQNRRWHR